MPLNLMQLYGERYQVGLEPGTYWRKGMIPDPWTLQLLCGFGHIYPYSDKQLGYYCDGPRLMQRLMREQPQIEVAQEGDFEAVFLFPPGQFETIAQYAKPRRKRRLSEAVKAKLVAAGYETRFFGPKRGAQFASRGQIRPQKSNET